MLSMINIPGHVPSQYSASEINTDIKHTTHPILRSLKLIIIVPGDLVAVLAAMLVLQDLAVTSQLGT